VGREKPVETLSFDHISPKLEASTPAAILYLDVSSASSSSALLSYLHEHAMAYPSFRYVVRYKPTLSAESRSKGRKSVLSGYGVELALKNTDYLVVDDRATGTGGKDHAQAPVVGAKQDNAEGPFAAILGSDPWSELSTPLRPTEVASTLPRLLLVRS
jgi:UDP-glucose:glycoprotein glucosyltransferase